jgi:hypothetical protein
VYGRFDRLQGILISRQKMSDSAGVARRRGQAHLPDPEITGVDSLFFSEKSSGRAYRAVKSSFKVRKAGLPPLVT